MLAFYCSYYRASPRELGPIHRLVEGTPVETQSTGSPLPPSLFDVASGAILHLRAPVHRGIGKIPVSERWRGPGVR